MKTNTISILAIILFSTLVPVSPALALGGLLSGDGVKDTYAALLPGFASQQATNGGKEGEVASTLTNYETTQEGIRAIQEIQVDAADEVQVDENVCEAISLTQQGAGAVSAQRDANHRIVRNNLIDASVGKVGTLGSLSDGERTQWRAKEFREKYCPVSGQGDGLSEFCDSSTISDEDIMAHLDPSCIMGWKSVDGDPANGAPNEACMTFLSYISPANKPLRLPNKKKLSSAELANVDSAIMEYYYPLMQHGSLVSDTFASMHAKTLKSTNTTSIDTFRELLTELGFDPNLHIPDASSGLSEVAQLEVISKFMVANPSFMLKLQSDASSIQRSRALLRTISLRLDEGIGDMIAEKGRHMTAINALMLRDDRERANAGLQLISKK